MLLFQDPDEWQFGDLKSWNLSLFFSSLCFYLRDSKEEWRKTVYNKRLIRIIEETNTFCKKKKVLWSSFYCLDFKGADKRSEFLKEYFPERYPPSPSDDDCPHVEFVDDPETKTCPQCKMLPPHWRCVQVIGVKGNPRSDEYQGDVLTCAPRNDYPHPVSYNSFLL